MNTTFDLQLLFLDNDEWGLMKEFGEQDVG